MARCKHRDQLNLCTTKAWLQGCVVTQPEKERKIVTDIVNMTNMDLRVVLLLALLGKTTVQQFCVNSAKLLNGPL